MNELFVFRRPSSLCPRSPLPSRFPTPGHRAPYAIAATARPPTQPKEPQAQARRLPGVHARDGRIEKRRRGRARRKWKGRRGRLLPAEEAARGRGRGGARGSGFWRPPHSNDGTRRPCRSSRPSPCASRSGGPRPRAPRPTKAEERAAPAPVAAAAHSAVDVGARAAGLPTCRSWPRAPTGRRAFCARGRSSHSGSRRRWRKSVPSFSLPPWVMAAEYCPFPVAFVVLVVRGLPPHQHDGRDGRVQLELDAPLSTRSKRV